MILAVRLVSAAPCTAIRASITKMQIARMVNRTNCTHPLTSPLTVHPGLFADLCLHRRTVHGLKLLILDDWGLERSARSRDAILWRSSKTDTCRLLITSQIPVERSHDLIGDLRSRRPTGDSLPYRTGRPDARGPDRRCRTPGR
jgi:hypothetical protein